MSNHVPKKVQLRKASNILVLDYDDLGTVELSCEYLRVYSPSAEVKGHGPGQEVLQTGKCHVAIEQIESVGNYALKFIFSDGHDTGIYSWQYLHELSCHQSDYWQRYLNRLDAANASRDPDVSVLKFDP